MAIARTFEPLAHTSLTTTASSIEFSSISSSYTDLYFVFNGIHSTGTATQWGIRVNGDTGSNYQAVILGQTAGTSTISLYEQNANTYGFLGWVISGKSNMYELHLNNYANTNSYKTMMGWGNTLATRQNMIGGAMWRSTNAVTSVTFLPASGNFATDTSITMYGITRA